MQNLRLLCCLGLATLATVPLHSQRREKEDSSVQTGASPEMARLAKALAGDWDTAETMEPSQFFPKGGSRRGISHVRLTAGGTTLLSQVHSNGSAGELDGFLAIWWDRSAGVYRFFACFNDPASPCEDRGTAHWDGDAFVNDYQEDVNGKKTKFRDSFIHITESSHSLVAAMDNGSGAMQTLITTKSKRR
jgi:hypothetical protein